MGLRGSHLRRADRIRVSRDYQRARQLGQRVATRCFVMLMTERTQAASGHRGARLGLTVSRKVGNAVTRNRVKRRVREWFRRQRGEFAEDLDLVVIARPAAAALSQAEVEAELGAGLARA